MIEKENEDLKRARGRPSGAKNIKGCPYPWKYNVVRYASDVIPAVLDILWRRGSLRLTEIVQNLCIESPHESRWFVGIPLEPSAIAKIITEAVERGFLIVTNGGIHGSQEITRYRAATERTGWYWRGDLVSGNALSQVAFRAKEKVVIAPKNLRARLDSGWDVEASIRIKSGKGAETKREKVNKYVPCSE